MALKYKISLITPVYNAGSYLDDAISSVKEQTIGFENIEWLLVDDCSTDGSYEKILQLAAQYPNVRVLKTPQNSGTPAEPRNIALDNVSAPYVMFLDNDDALFPDACRVLYDEIERTGVDMVSGEAELMHSEQFTKEERAQLLCRYDKQYMGLCEVTLPLDDSIRAYVLNHWSKIYRTEIIEKYHIRCLKGELWEDLLFLDQYISCCQKLKHIPDKIIYYRVRRESLSHVPSKSFHCSIPKSVAYGYKHMEEIGGRQLQIYSDLIGRYDTALEYHIGLLLNDNIMTDDDIAECVLAWKEAFCLASKYNTMLHSAYCKILEDDFVSGDDKKALFHFFTLRELYRERQAELENIFNSRSWRIISKIAEIKKKIFG